MFQSFTAPMSPLSPDHSTLPSHRPVRARTGKSCMSDAEIIAFVDRYMPAYELFLEGVRSPTQCWAGQGMSINLGESREVLGTGKF